MTLAEFEAKLKELNLPPDTKIGVSAFGGLRQAKEIKSVTIGFDWDSGWLVLHPTIPLEIYRKNA